MDEKDLSASLLRVDPSAPVTTEALPNEEAFELTSLGEIMVESGVMNVGVVRAVAGETLTILNERITSKLTPALNTGTAMDVLILVGAAIREVRAELIGSGTQASTAERAMTTHRSAAQKSNSSDRVGEASSVHDFREGRDSQR